MLDVVPMVLQHLRWEADLSAFLFWVVAGVFIATSPWKLPPVFKGLVVAIILLIPLALVIGSQEPASLVPISLSTLILSSSAGWVLGRWVQ
jgi:hypothetical protein